MSFSIGKSIRALAVLAAFAASGVFLACADGEKKPPEHYDGNITVRGDGVTVAWDSVSGAASYNVYRAPSRFGEYEFVSSQRQTSYDGDDIYGYYRVEALDASGDAISTELYSYDIQTFGDGVRVYAPTDGAEAIKSDIERFRSETSQFGSGRFAALFKAGDYGELDLTMRYYMTYSGLGGLPTDTEIGGFNVYGELPGGNATCNFWCGIENLTVNSSVQWAVSQATSFRRMRVNGDMSLVDKGSTPWASGGFIADSHVTGTVNAGGQQQWLARNSQWNSWVGSDINMVFVGCDGAFADKSYVWPTRRITTLDGPTFMREKPYLVFDGGYYVCVPQPRKTASGASWTGGGDTAERIALKDFYVARADTDTADTVNAALAKGYHILFTPGIYTLDSPVVVERGNTVLLGMGLATLAVGDGNADTALRIVNCNGVTVSGLLIDAGTSSNSLMAIGTKDGGEHRVDPPVFHDLYFRIGGARSGKTSVDTAVIVEADDVITDNFWVWRADHGVQNSVGWDVNTAKCGVIVNGARMTAYGLMVEHFQQYQTVWNGEDGMTVFYQSETPYDPPEQSYWMSEWKGQTYEGYASYKVSDGVNSHTLYGAGVYYVASSRMKNVFNIDHGIELPSNPGIRAEHLAIANFLTYGGGIKHIVNEYGDGLFTSTAGKKQFTSFIGGVATK